jgi:hypothetical protein
MRDFGAETQRIGFMARDRRALCPFSLRSIRARQHQQRSLTTYLLPHNNIG